MIIKLYIYRSFEQTVMTHKIDQMTTLLAFLGPPTVHHKWMQVIPNLGNHQSWWVFRSIYTIAITRSSSYENARHTLHDPREVHAHVCIYIACVLYIRSRIESKKPRTSTFLWVILSLSFFLSLSLSLFLSLSLSHTHTHTHSYPPPHAYRVGPLAPKKKITVRYRAVRYEYGVSPGM